MDRNSATLRNNNHNDINAALAADLIEAVEASRAADALYLKRGGSFYNEKRLEARAALKATKARVKAEALGCFMDVFQAAGICR